MSALVEKVLAVAAYEADVLKVREVGGNNAGPRVEQYQAAVGIEMVRPRPAWCAAFVAWVLREAGVRGFPMTGDTWAIRTWAKQHGVYTKTPHRGDVFLLLDKHGDPEHTGFVTGVSDLGGSVTTIEGNTGGYSDTDGSGVFRKTRKVSECMFVHWWKALAPVHEPQVFVKTPAGDVKIPCNLKIENGRARVDLRPFAVSFGYDIEVMSNGDIRLHRK